MKLLKAALGLTLSDEERRALEAKYGGDAGPTVGSEQSQSGARKRAWGDYQKSRDQLID